TSSTGLTADLSLAGSACDAYGTDIKDLKLVVNHDSAKRLHVKIEDAAKTAYQVPQSVFPTPDSSKSVSSKDSELEFSHVESPFSFKVTRRSNGEVLFDTSAAALVFEDQYLRLRTSLPEDPNLYGLGEHSDSFRLNTTDYTRTLWSRDSYGIPAGTNLYGNHPIYFDHRGEKGSHGVFLLSSAGMDVKINRTETEGQYLDDVAFTEIPLHIRGGAIVPMRAASGMTTSEVRKQPFDLVVAPGKDGKATGSLYLDDGDSIEQRATSAIRMEYDGGALTVSGRFDYTAEDNTVATVTIMGVDPAPKNPQWRAGGRKGGWKGEWKGATEQKGDAGHGRKRDGKSDQAGWKYDGQTKTVTIAVNQKLDGEFTVKL
ncbi:hypothetical protein B0A49_09675, partial [Cryomyces minteri]